VTVTKISWYLCGLFIFALVAFSAVTVAPGAETTQRVVVGTAAALAVLFAFVALIFRRFRISEPAWLIRTMQGFALLATILVLLFAVG
jgi:nitrate reductase gamma subunit